MKLVSKTDSLNTIESILDHVIFYSYIRIIIEECKGIARHLQFVQFSHVRRVVANQAAYYLAKFSLLNSDSIWIEESSDRISAVYAFDLMPDLSLSQVFAVLPSKSSLNFGVFCLYFFDPFQFPISNSFFGFFFTINLSKYHCSLSKVTSLLKFSNIILIGLYL
jgi:hypothetical protein